VEAKRTKSILTTVAAAKEIRNHLTAVPAAAAAELTLVILSISRHTTIALAAELTQVILNIFRHMPAVSTALRILFLNIINYLYGCHQIMSKRKRPYLRHLY
jgi:uncharacterized membrane protein